ncbi:MAG: class I SAM-dependent rRNA methyltransferase [Muribaculaceae bacterium]|nr:class I SAM-dependent rRNA methyltransferase [Muribaculaceae bacterium]
MPEIRLKRGKEESLKRFHPWVFSGAVASLPDNLQEGDLVKVVSSTGELLGSGHWQIGSIAVRMLEFGPGSVDDEFYRRRLRQAYDMRQSLGLLREDNDCVRLVHGEGDFLPGLVVDLYGNTAVMQAHSPGMHMERARIAEALTELPQVGSVYYKSDTTLPFKAGLDPVNGYLLGTESEAVATENGLRFNIDWLRGQKTGFFLDQRDNRALLERYAKGRDVLNMFCYTGGFSVYAMRGGAKRVVSVDSSAKAIALTRANIELNFPDDPRHTAIAEDAFKYLAEMPDGAFDLIVLDPPAFAKHRGALKNGLLGYRKLNARAFEKIRPGGILFTFSCSQVVSKDAFRAAVFTAAAQSGRKVRILHQLTQGADHPVSIYHPEGEYLKGLVLQVE